MRKDYIKELEKSLEVIKSIPLRHNSWNIRVNNYKMFLEDELKEERLQNKPVMYHEFYKNKLIEYMLLNKKDGWVNKIMIEDLAIELEIYASHLEVKTSLAYSKNRLRFNIISYTNNEKRYFREKLCSFCMRGYKALAEFRQTEKRISRLNNENKQEYLQISFIDHHRKNHMKGKTLILTKEDILNWEIKVEEIFEEGYTDMDFDYRICLPYQPQKQYYYKIRNPKVSNWKNKLMKEIKEENKNYEGV